MGRERACWFQACPGRLYDAPRKRKKFSKVTPGGIRNVTPSAKCFSTSETIIISSFAITFSSPVYLNLFVCYLGGVIVFSKNMADICVYQSRSYIIAELHARASRARGRSTIAK